MRPHLLSLVGAASLVLGLSVACAQRGTDDPAARDANRRYIGHSADECSRIRFRCEPGEEYFSDDNGCGCERVDGGAAGAGASPAPDAGGAEGAEGMPDGVGEGAPAGDAGAPAAPAGGTVTSCMEGPRPEMCTEEYAPVCGSLGPDAACAAPPCVETFSNACAACRDPRVVSHVPGACP